MFKIILLVVVALAIVMVLAALKRKGAGGKAGSYYLRKALFSPAERSFLEVLDHEVPAGVRVFGKVRLEDIFGVVSGLERGARQAARNRINRKHVDFLLVRASDFAPLAGIELDDRSHEAEDRQQRDAFVDEVFASGGLPLLHVPAQRSYNPAEIRAKVASMLSANKSAT
jgi:hypothetical protein